ncbi:unnamed protein product, partial [Pylaiella littoralis]
MAMPGPSLGVGEEVLITVYAVHKKCPGTVWFTTRRALWRAADGKAAVQRVEVPWAAVMSFQCSPASEARAMMRLLRVAEGQPPIIFRFTETPGDTPREVLERAQAAVRKALKGGAEAGNSSVGGGAGAAEGAGVGGSSKGAAKGKGGKDGAKGGALKKMKWKTRGGLMGSASGGQSLRHSRDRDSMPGGRMRDVHDARRRAALLAGDEVLTAQYREMVDGGVVTEEEFWESRRRTLAEDDAKAASKHTGTPSEMPSDLVAEKTSTGTLKFKLNARTIHSIFTMYPIVFKAYQANVPTEMTEKEFWTKYIQSAYFNRDRGSGSGSSGGGGANSGSTSSAISGNKRKSLEAGGGEGGQDDMFLRFAAQEAEREKKEKEEGGGAAGAKRARAAAAAAAAAGAGGAAAGVEGGGRLEAGSVDPMVDLTSQWGDHHAREVDDSDPLEEQTEAANKRKEVIGKFNRHARLVMQPPDGGGTGAGGGRPALVDSAESATDLPELRIHQEVSREKLEIANKKRYHGGSNSKLGGGASNGASARASSQAGPSSWPQSRRLIGAVTLAEAKAQLGPGFSILGAGRPCVARAVVAPRQALSALRECTKEADKGIGDAFRLQGYEDFIGGMHRHFQIVGELLRHFYASLDRPRSDPGAVAKLARLETRMDSKYKELNKERQGLPRNADGNRLSAVIKPLLDCLDHAFQKLEESKARSGGGG